MKKSNALPKIDEIAKKMFCLEETIRVGTEEASIKIDNHPHFKMFVQFKKPFQIANCAEYTSDVADLMWYAKVTSDLAKIHKIVLTKYREKLPIFKELENELLELKKERQKELLVSTNPDSEVVAIDIMLNQKRELSKKISTTREDVVVKLLALMPVVHYLNDINGVMKDMENMVGYAKAFVEINQYLNNPNRPDDGKFYCSRQDRASRINNYIRKNFRHSESISEDVFNAEALIFSKLILELDNIVEPE